MIRIHDTRLAIHDALTFGATTKKNPLIRESASTNGSGVDELRLAGVHAALKGVSVPARQWLEYGYGAHAGREHEEFVSGLLFDFMESREPKVVPAKRVARVERILYFSKAAPQEMKFRLFAHKAKYSQAELARAIGVSPANFVRDGWSDRWGSCLNELNRLDAELVAAVEPLCVLWQAAA